MKNLIKVLPVPYNVEEEEFHLSDFWWGGRGGWWYGEWGYDAWESQPYSDPLIIINNRYMLVTQDVWDEVKKWSGTHREGMVLHLSEEDQALYLLIYGGI